MLIRKEYLEKLELSYWKHKMDVYGYKAAHDEYRYFQEEILEQSYYMESNPNVLDFLKDFVPYKIAYSPIEYRDIYSPSELDKLLLMIAEPEVAQLLFLNLLQAQYDDSCQDVLSDYEDHYIILDHLVHLPKLDISLDQTLKQTIEWFEVGLEGLDS